MWRRVAVVGTYVSGERIASINRLLQLLVTADVPGSLILFTLMMEALRSSFLQEPNGGTSQKT
jgi:hypothetical protein